METLEVDIENKQNNQPNKAGRSQDHLHSHRGRTQFSVSEGSVRVWGIQGLMLHTSPALGPQALWAG
jgi:hypothetical protein